MQHGRITQEYIEVLKNQQVLEIMHSSFQDKGNDSYLQVFRKILNKPTIDFNMLYVKVVLHDVRNEYITPILRIR